MTLSMFVNDRRDNWHELLPFVMHAYQTSVHESTGYSPFRLMMGEECSLPQDVTTEELRASREHDVAPILLLCGCGTLWRLPMTKLDIHYIVLPPGVNDCIAHLMCYRYAVINDLKLFATSIRKWSRHLTDFPTIKSVPNTRLAGAMSHSVKRDLRPPVFD